MIDGAIIALLFAVGVAVGMSDDHDGTENALIRVDMSEYMEKHSVSKMIGSPPGYVGYDEGGQLSEKVSEEPQNIRD